MLIPGALAVGSISGGKVISSYHRAYRVIQPDVFGHSKRDDTKCRANNKRKIKVAHRCSGGPLYYELD
ncbi:MAG: hypothetical protein BZY81_00365 [SAR202 cluster bacterium Io17-Chloro-G4]|nr:MAG: hypothetical protein BZY81_00365 [SAR202 cluster bacterium Io17-Chloro-G4]